MGIENLSDDELKALVADPKKFLGSGSNQAKLLGITTKAAKERVVKQAEALNIKKDAINALIVDGVGNVIAAAVGKVIM